MVVGVPKEIKDCESRVAVVPSGVQRLCDDGHRLLIERRAGLGAGICDEQYVKAGAEIVDSAEDVFSQADLVVKVKEPLAQEYGLVRPGQMVFTYFHLAASRTLTEAMVDSNAICIAYETIRLPNGELPLLKPMSEIAGRMSVQEGAKCLEGPQGGKGVLLSGASGVAPASVVVLGGGVVGSNAARVAAGMGARVTILDVDTDRLRHLDEVMPANVTTLYSDPCAIRSLIRSADMIIGCVLVCGERAPVLISRDMLAEMQPGTVLVDVAVDQGGCMETSRPTTHQAPTYVIDDILHYCVANMPGAVAKTSTYALTNDTLPYVRKIASVADPSALLNDQIVSSGINVFGGKLLLDGLPEWPAPANVC